VPDLVGYGESRAPESMRIDMASQARWMLELLDRLGLARATLVAHDVGAAAAQLMVVAARERWRGLAVLDGVYETEWAMEAIAGIQTWQAADAHRLFPVLARRLGRSAELRQMLTSYQGADGGSRLIRAARDLDPQQTAHISAQLRASGVPALVLWGERDEYLPVGTVAKPLAELIGATLVEVPGGHFTPLDCPLEVARELRDFLARLPPERQS
jgi:pimeloyl-ACP methyl ester carboxylesterase